MENVGRSFRTEKFKDYGKGKNYLGIKTRADVVRDIELNYLRFLKDFKNKKILDLGCGQGYFLDFLKKHGFSDYSGIDIDKDLVALCKQKSHSAICDDAFDFFEKTKDKYDVVVLNDVLEHFKKAEGIALLKLVNGRMQKNGIIIIRVPNANFMFASSIRYGDFTHEVLYENESLQQILRLSGFDTFYIGDYAYGLFGNKRSVKTALVSIARKTILLCHGVVLRIVAGRRYNEFDIFAVGVKT